MMEFFLLNYNRRFIKKCTIKMHVARELSMEIFIISESLTFL